LIAHITPNRRVCVLRETFYGVEYNKQKAGKYGHDIGLGGYYKGE